MIDLEKTEKGQILILEEKQGLLRHYQGVIVEKVDFNEKLIYGRIVDIDKNLIDQNKKEGITSFRPDELSPLKGILIGKDQVIRHFQEESQVQKKLLFQITKQGMKHLSPQTQAQLQGYFQGMAQEGDR